LSRGETTFGISSPISVLFGAKHSPRAISQGAISGRGSYFWTRELFLDEGTVSGRGSRRGSRFGTRELFLNEGAICRVQLCLTFQLIQRRSSTYGGLSVVVNVGNSGWWSNREGCPYREQVVCRFEALGLLLHLIFGILRRSRSSISAVSHLRPMAAVGGG
jgi:hypothetical protein